MNSKIKNLIWVLVVVNILIGGCRNRGVLSNGTVQNTEAWKTYVNERRNFLIKYPLPWEIELDGYDFIVLTPSKEKNWQPDKPADIPKDPRIRIDIGEYVRERLGPKYFPETISPEILEEWLKRKIENGEARDFTKRTINDFPAFEITEIRDPGYDKVIYWRFKDLNNLIRIQTGHESKYLDEFDKMVNTLQQIE